MKIAYFTDSLPPLVDGVSTSYLHLADFLEAQNIDFRFYSAFKPDDSFKWSHRVRKVLSLPLPVYKPYRFCLPVSDKLKQELYEFNPDIIQTASPSLLGNFGLQFARKHKVPAVSSFHTDFVSYLKYHGLDRVEDYGWSFLRKFYNRFDTVYSPSLTMKKILQNLGFKNVSIWGRGVDLESFSPDHRSQKLRRSITRSDKPILLYVGRLVKEKGLIGLVEACSLLNQKGYEFKLAFVGDGYLKDELRMRYPEAVFPGFLKGKALSHWYASADIFVFPSSTETFGNVVQEAFASGLPVIGVPRGGVVDLILEGKNGLFSKPESPESLAEKIKILLDNPALRTQFGRNARILIHNYSWENINKKLLDSYSEIISASMKSHLKKIHLVH